MGFFFSPCQKCKQKNSGKWGFRSRSVYGGYLGGVYFWFQEHKEWIASYSVRTENNWIQQKCNCKILS